LLVILCLCLSGFAGAQDRATPPEVAKAQDPLVLDEKRQDRGGEPLPVCAVARFRYLDRLKSGYSYPVFSADGKVLAALAADGKPSNNKITVWEIETGKRVGELPVEEGAPRTFVLSANGTEVFTLNTLLRTLVRWDLATQKPIFKIGLDKLSESGVTCREMLVLSPDGRTLFSDNIEAELYEIRAGNKIRLPQTLEEPQTVFWETVSGKRQGTLPKVSEEEPTLLAFTPDCRQIVLAVHPDLILFWDLATEKVTKRVEVKGKPFSLSADCKVLAVMGPDDGRGKEFRQKNQGKLVAPIDIWDLESCHRRLRMWITYANAQMALSPDGRFLVINDDLSFREQAGPTEVRVRERRGPALWDATSGEHLATLIGYKSDYRSFALSPDGKYLVTDGAEAEDPMGAHTVLLWDVAAAIRAKPNQRTALLVERDKIADSDTAKPEAPAPEKVLSSQRLNQLWSDLADVDAARAYRAMWSLALHPKSSLPLLRERLKPATAPSTEYVKRLIKDLNSEDYATREAANAELDNCALLIGAELRGALKFTESKEAQRRLQKLVKGLDPPYTEGTPLRRLRAVEALEHIGTSEAQELLQELGKGAPAALETQAAKEALERIAIRTKRLTKMP
jgi:WD40 repeat protein